MTSGDRGEWRLMGGQERWAAAWRIGLRLEQLVHTARQHGLVFSRDERGGRLVLSIPGKGGVTPVASVSWSDGSIPTPKSPPITEAAGDPIWARILGSLEGDPTPEGAVMREVGEGQHRKGLAKYRAPLTHKTLSLEEAARYACEEAADQCAYQTALLLLMEEEQGEDHPLLGEVRRDAVMARAAWRRSAAMVLKMRELEGR